MQLKFPFSSAGRLGKIGMVLSTKERLFLYLAIFILFGSLLGWAINYYLNATEKVADFGGEYTEGVVGQPLYVNPILAFQSNDVDWMLSHLIFSSLITYDEQGNLVGDLAESFESLDDGRRYKITLKQGVKWHDKVELTAQDVAFTIKLIQDPAYKSIALRGDLQNVKVNVEDDYTLIFELEEPYAPFLNKLTFGILPKHVFEEIPTDNFLLTKFNLEPVGSGPYEFSKSEKDDEDNFTSYQLLANPEYHGGKPFLDKINFNFYSSEDELFEAYGKKEINGFGILSYDRVGELIARRDTRTHVFQTSRYFAVFFNQTKSVPLANKEIRKALNYATNRDEIIDQAFTGYASKVTSPILESFGQFAPDGSIERLNYDPAKAEEILEKQGWKKDEDGIRKKDGEVLEISLVTTKWADLAKTAEILKSQWEKVGVRLNITNLEFANIQQNFIKTREYQSILFGQEYTGNDPDPYLFWHSSFKKDPGRNIAVYENQSADKLLVDARKSSNLDERKQKYAEFEKLITEDAPAVFLYSPSYVYITNVKIKGVETENIVNPSYRMKWANQWFVKTKRQKKSE